MSIIEVLDNAREELHGSSDGSLSLAARKKIIFELQPRTNTVDALDVGYERRVVLDILCVQHAMHFWTQVFPDDDGPTQMLAVASRVMTNRMTHEEAEAVRGSFYVDAVEDKDYESNQYSAMFVAHAAANVIVTALVKDLHDSLPEEDSDEDMEVESYLPSYLCASAFAGGLTGRNSGNSERRKNFWEWYIEDAVGEVLRQ